MDSEKKKISQKESQKLHFVAGQVKKYPCLFHENKSNKNINKESDVLKNAKEAKASELQLVEDSI